MRLAQARWHKVWIVQARKCRFRISGAGVKHGLREGIQRYPFDTPVRKAGRDWEGVVDEADGVAVVARAAAGPSASGRDVTAPAPEPAAGP